MIGLSNLRLLVVDDNEQMRTIIGAVLIGAGIRDLRFAPDGRRGLEAMRAFQLDVVFVDYEMPIMHGLDFLSAVRALETEARFTPVIMLTGHADMLRLNQARDRGVTEFLAKPVTAKSILTRLNAVIYHQRPFVDSEHYFGPDRRRRQTLDYSGPFRRASDTTED